MPTGLTAIKDDVFSHCYALTTIEIPEGVTELGVRAFFDSGLRRITLPASVTSIGNIAFSICDQLTGISVHPDNPQFRSVDGVLYDKTLTTLHQCPKGKVGAVTVPETVTDIVPNAFSQCESLAKVRFMGDAPNMGPSGSLPFTVCFFAGRTGFTLPTWMNFNAEEDGAATAFGLWLVDQELAYDRPLELTPSGDGVNLFLAYALGLDPFENNSMRIPQAALSPTDLALTFYAGKPGVVYTVEWSDNLQDWASTGVSLSGPDGDGRLTATVSRGSTARYLRLSVSSK